MKKTICILLIIIISINVFTLEISKRQIVKEGNKGLISSTEINTPDVKKNPIQEARKDAKTSVMPVVWYIKGFLSSCLLPVLLNQFIVIDPRATPEYTALTSLVCCLSTILWAYVTVPEVPQDKIKDESPNYKRAYSDTYRKIVRKNNVLAVCLTGVTSIIAAIVFLFLLLRSLASSL